MHIKCPLTHLKLLSTLLLVALSAGLSQQAAAQEYQTAVGIRAGLGSGLSMKHFITRYTAIEGIIESRYDGINAVVLHEWQQAKLGEYGVEWYYGAGAHIGAWNGGPQQPWFNEDYNRVHHVFGLDGVIGMEYTFKEIPLNLSLDWRPAFNITEHTGFWLNNFGINARYVIR